MKKHNSMFGMYMQFFYFSNEKNVWIWWRDVDVGEILMQKRKCLFWTPCAAHCLDLMLEDFEKRIKDHNYTIAKGKKITMYIYSRAMFLNWLRDFTTGRELIRSTATRFATSYLTLSCLNEFKGELMAMFSSEQIGRAHVWTPVTS